jgi:hypothetical protein
MACARLEFIRSLIGESSCLNLDSVTDPKVALTAVSL